MLAFPSTVKYINRKGRPARIFATRLSDRSMYEIFPARTQDPEQGSADTHSLFWDQDKGSNDHGA